MSKNSSNKLQEVIATLLGPNGCPWDKKQTPQSLCDYLIEECFELVEAITSKDIENIKEELGDVFFLLFFLVHLFQDQFTLEEVFDYTAAKMIGRHPHVFGNKSIQNIDELLSMWEKIKKEEQRKKQKKSSSLDSIPSALPPLLRAYRINSKAARLGFTWPNEEELEKKLQEEWAEWLEAKKTGKLEKMEEELGDYLFCLTEYARRNQIKPNTALNLANKKFLTRFKLMEELAEKRNLSLENLSLQQLEALWQEAKELQQAT
ncbi:MAG: MazG family protein [Desulfonauticus sp. 38_4375]|nr:MAG: MazG family protein [Desulfonauticus sp. 38_4375]